MPTNGFPIKTLKVEFLAGEQKATDLTKDCIGALRNVSRVRTRVLSPERAVFWVIYLSKPFQKGTLKPKGILSQPECPGVQLIAGLFPRGSLAALKGWCGFGSLSLAGSGDPRHRHLSCEWFGALLVDCKRKSKRTPTSVVVAIFPAFCLFVSLFSVGKLFDVCFRPVSRRAKKAGCMVFFLWTLQAAKPPF